MELDINVVVERRPVDLLAPAREAKLPSIFVFSAPNVGTVVSECVRLCG